MTFLNPIVLLGLAAAAIPIILHLFNLRKLRTIPFSSLRFLKELQKTRMRRVKIRQLLLLILRTLIIVSLVFAFSRPVLRTSLAGLAGGRATTTMVVILDDSPSMAVRNEQGVLFQQARDAAAQITSLAQEGDNLYLLKLSEIRHTKEFLPSRSRDALLSALSLSQVSQETVPFRSAISAAAGILSASTNANRELYLITDGQATQFQRGPESTDSLTRPVPGTKVFMIPVGNDNTNNASVSSVAVSTRMIAQGRPVRVDATINNYSSVPLHSALAGLHFDGARMTQQALDIPAGGAVHTSLVASPKRRGILKGYVEIDDDQLEIDNKRFFTLHVPEHIRVLLAGPPADFRLPALALTLSGDTAVAGLFSVRQVPSSNLNGIDVHGYDVIILCGMHEFSPADAERLVGFVQAGGGLLMFPGEQSDIVNYNQVLFPRLGMPPVSPAPPYDPAGGSFLSFGRVDLAHPVFTGLFDQTSGRRRTSGLAESPHVYRAIRSQPGGNGTAIISLSDGTPFLSEYKSGSGRVFLCAVEAGLTWSDFPVKGLFAPLVHRATQYLAAKDEDAQSFIAGDRLHFSARLQPSAAAGPFVLRSPSGVDERLVPVSLSSSGVASFESTAPGEVGIYELHSGNDVVQEAAVNVSPAESDLHKATESEIESFWKDEGVPYGDIATIAGGNNIGPAMQQSRFGVELWKHFLILTLLLAIAEMVVGREAKQEQE